jgi:sec-independent protein translocase protein TatB
MFNIGGGELIVIMLIALIVLGPSRLPDAARQIGRAMSELRRVSTSFQNEVRGALDTADEPNRASTRPGGSGPEATAADATAPARPPRREPLVAGPGLPARGAAPAGTADTPPRPSAQARAAAKKANPPRSAASKRSTTSKASPTKKAAASRNGTAVKKAGAASKRASSPSRRAKG